MKKLIFIILLAVTAFANSQIPAPKPGGNGGSPSGPASGDLGGNYPSPTVTASHITSGGASFTDKISAATTGATIAIPSLAVTDNEAAASFMYPIKALAPNMANGNSAFIELGNVESTNNAFLMSYIKAGLNSAANRFAIQPFSNPVALSIFAGSQHVNIGSSGIDAGYNLDVGGSFRAQTSITTPFLIPSGSSPTCTVGGAAGTGATCTVTGTNIAHVVTVNTGTATTSADVLVTVTYSQTLSAVPFGCSLTARNTNAVEQTSMVYTTAPSTTSYTLSVAGSAIPISSTFAWYDVCI